MPKIPLTYLANTLILFLETVHLFPMALAEGVKSQVIDSDSDFYTDELYHELSLEYNTQELTSLDDDGLEKETHPPWMDLDFLADKNSSESEISSEIDSLDDISHPTTEEPYKDAILRLQCDDPWFWNSFKCLYLDMRERNFIERTRHNAIVVAWILGPPLVIFVLMICSFCVVACCLRARVKQFEKKMNDYRDRYEPGSIKLEDGTVRKYDPTEEEVAAFENLMSTLVSIV